MLADREASMQTDRHTDRFNELANVSEFSFMSKKKKRMLESKLVKRSFAVINLTKGKKTLDRVTVNEFQNCALEKQEERKVAEKDLCMVICYLSLFPLPVLEQREKKNIIRRNISTIYVKLSLLCSCIG